MSEHKAYADYSEKTDNVHHADESFPEHPKEALGDDPEYSPKEQRKIIHRVDRRLILTCGVLYCISLMDRTNLPAAALAGMNVELDMVVGFRYVSLIVCRMYL